MLSLDDPRWLGMQGGYRVPYDPRPAIRKLADNFADQPAWDELWNELHHQADVGDASYAALVALADVAQAAPSRDWNIYALAATIEVERHADDNPAIPGWLEPDYRRAWNSLTNLALQDLRIATDRNVVRSAFAVVALERGDAKLGALLWFIGDAEVTEYVEEHLAWSERYPAVNTSHLR